MRSSSHFAAKRGCLNFWTGYPHHQEDHAEPAEHLRVLMAPIVLTAPMNIHSTPPPFWEGRVCLVNLVCLVCPCLLNSLAFVAASNFQGISVQRTVGNF